MTDLGHKIGASIATALAGALLGWTVHSFTLDGRVVAIESTLGRIEARLDAMAGGVKR